MGLLNSETLYQLALLAPVFLFSLTVHEFAHARTALAFGDPTAQQMGRVSLNPLVHLDLMGTIVLLVTRAFGWAKPVPVNPANLHPRRLGDIAVSAAGPASNLMLAIIAGLLLRLLIRFGSPMSEELFKNVGIVLYVTMAANVGLCVFNLIPLFPLDGHHILREMISPRKHVDFMRWQMRYGRVILMGLIFIPMVMDRFGQRNFPSPIRFLYEYALVLVTRALGLS